MKIAQNFALVTMYLLISGCGLILDIACIASGTPRTVSEEDKSDARHDLEKVKGSSGFSVGNPCQELAG